MGAPTHVDNAIYDLLSKQCPAMWLGIPIGAGHVFWVHNWTGSDAAANPGTDPNQPLATITEALTRCVSDRNDYIMVLQHYQEDNIIVNKDLVHIIGLTANPDLPFIVLQSDDNDEPIFVLTSSGNHVEIAGFILGGGVGHGSIECTASAVQQANIHNNAFGHRFVGANTPDYGILVTHNATAIRIADNIFYGKDANDKVEGLIEVDAIHLFAADDPMNGVIRNNRFMGIPGVGINLSYPGDHGGLIIEDNRHFVAIADGLAAGWAITLQAAVVGCMVNNNHAMQTGNGTGSNPYRDLTSPGDITAIKNGWGMNYSGQAVTVPAIA